VSLEELTVWLKPRLAKYKIPKAIVILPEMPRNPLGKVNKKLLVRLFDDKKQAPPLRAISV
jgi:acyl-CoA synthetase (AMP-forming)/AMP-acid ligase II